MDGRAWGEARGSLGRGGWGEEDGAGNETGEGDSMWGRQPRIPE